MELFENPHYYICQTLYNLFPGGHLVLEKYEELLFKEFEVKLEHGLKLIEFQKNGSSKQAANISTILSRREICKKMITNIEMLILHLPFPNNEGHCKELKKKTIQTLHQLKFKVFH